MQTPPLFYIKGESIMINAVEYLEGLKRMCTYYSPTCEKCPLHGCGENEVEKPMECVEAVEAWLEAHPTRKYFNVQKYIMQTIEEGIGDDALLELLGEGGWVRDCVGKEVVNRVAVGTSYSILDSWCTVVGDGIEEEDKEDM